MGFLNSLLKKKDSKSPLEQLKDKANAAPDDAKLQQEVATQLKTAGDFYGASEYARRAAQAHHKAGFAQKAAAVLKTAMAWGQPTPELVQDLVDTLLQLKLKEDARGALLQLRKLQASDRDALARIDAKLTELGPGR